MGHAVQHHMMNEILLLFLGGAGRGERSVVTYVIYLIRTMCLRL